jgi:hypothetical protein
MPLLSNSGSIGLDTSGDHESIGGTENVQGFSAFVGKSGVYVFNLVIVLYFSSWADMVGSFGGVRRMGSNSIQDGEEKGAAMIESRDGCSLTTLRALPGRSLHTTDHRDNHCGSMAGMKPWYC